MRFVDTNILLYAVSTAVQERSKHEIALTILDAEDIALSVQVLQEFYVQATRTSRADPLTHEQAAALIESWLRFRVQENSVALLREAMSTSVRWQISYWDAAVVEAARAMRCATLLSEDLKRGMDFAGVKVENPFDT
ncbi:MAG TPA: PIN domain-containing protein [Steroidobacteraceae bacterium]|nr:PIN domain-containing protein [Steroidobacteraceae bacterium]HRX88606.1 PIN domain-containing protein [Steroidobacteraceae bacterium]